MNNCFHLCMYLCVYLFCLFFKFIFLSESVIQPLAKYEPQNWPFLGRTIPSSHLLELSSPEREAMEKCMSLWLTDTPSVFQNLINDILWDILNYFDFVYLDDILIFSRSFNSHRQNVCLVIQRLLERPSKIWFHKDQDVASWLIPSTQKQLQNLLGFAKLYRRFAHNYSQHP